MWQQFNPNPAGARIGDCAVRAVCGALGIDWVEVYIGLTKKGLAMFDLPTANRVWGSYLQDHGFRMKPVEAKCDKCYKVRNFAAEHPNGIFVIGTGSHAICIRDGKWYDTWDSGDEFPIYYFERSS